MWCSWTPAWSVVAGAGCTSSTTRTCATPRRRRRTRPASSARPTPRRIAARSPTRWPGTPARTGPGFRPARTSVAPTGNGPPSRPCRPAPGTSGAPSCRGIPRTAGAAASTCWCIPVAATCRCWWCGTRSPIRASARGRRPCTPRRRRPAAPTSPARSARSPATSSGWPTPAGCSRPAGSPIAIIRWVAWSGWTAMWWSGTTSRRRPGRAAAPRWPSTTPGSPTGWPWRVPPRPAPSRWPSRPGSWSAAPARGGPSAALTC
jgi:hypothetical protein